MSKRRLQRRLLDRMIFQTRLARSHLCDVLVGRLIDVVAGLEATLGDVGSTLHVLRPDHPLLHLC